MIVLHEDHTPEPDILTQQRPGFREEEAWVRGEEGLVPGNSGEGPRLRASVTAGLWHCLVIFCLLFPVTCLPPGSSPFNRTPATGHPHRPQSAKCRIMPDPQEQSSHCPKGPLLRTQKGPQTDVHGLSEHGLLAEQLGWGPQSHTEVRWAPLGVS